jgi:hypothetical protein
MSYPPPHNSRMNAKTLFEHSRLVDAFSIGKVNIVTRSGHA